MRGLAIDLGNSSCKMALFDDGVLDTVHRVRPEDMFEEVDRIIKDDVPEIAVVSSVAGHRDSIKAELGRRFSKVLILDSGTPMPITNTYRTPSTLGADRLASVVGTHMLFPDKNCIIFDFGTAITIDFLNKDGAYIGGNISLGLSTRLDATNHYTKQLPLVSKEGEITPAGLSTDEAIRNGVILGIMFEVEGYVNKNPERQVVLTGGDSIFFAERMKNRIFAVSNLVLIGLSHIAMYNATE